MLWRPTKQYKLDYSRSVCSVIYRLRAWFEEEEQRFDLLMDVQQGRVAATAEVPLELPPAVFGLDNRQLSALRRLFVSRRWRQQQQRRRRQQLRANKQTTFHNQIRTSLMRLCARSHFHPSDINIKNFRQLGTKYNAVCICMCGH